MILVAPRMIGIHVRTSFEQGRGVPAYIAVAQDNSGRARDTALAWAKAIGATRAGVLETSFAQETELDLFTEQAAEHDLNEAEKLARDIVERAGIE